MLSITSGLGKVTAKTLCDTYSLISEEGERQLVDLDQ